MGFFSSVKKIAKKATGFVKNLAAPVSGFLGGDAFGAISGLVGGVGSYIGQQRTNEANSAQALRSMEFSAGEAKKNRDFQETMRATQYQAAMDDMAEAGLNPILAYQQGGAGNLAGAQGVGAQASMQNPAAAGVENFGKSTASAMALKKFDQELTNLKQTEKSMKAAEARDWEQSYANSSAQLLNLALKDKATAEASSARSIAEMNEMLKKLERRDAKYKLDNPTMMKLEQWRKAIGFGGVQGVNPMRLMLRK